MDDVVRVHEVARLKHLPNYFLRFEWLDARLVISTLELVQDRPVKLLENEENAILLPEDLQQVDDMIVLQLLEDANLPQGRLAYLEEQGPKVRPRERAYKSLHIRRRRCP